VAEQKISPIKRVALNWLERQGFTLLNNRKLAGRDTWMADLGIRTVLDVGANEGETALEWHRKLPSARVVSLEPLPDSYAKMRTNMAGHEGWWQGLNVAAGAENGQQTIHRSGYALSSSLLPMAELHKTNYPYTAAITEQTIEVRRLDEVTSELGVSGPILLKLDVQGYELPALQGARNTLLQCGAAIIESSFGELYEGQKMFEDVYAFMLEAGFRYAGSGGQRNSPLNGRPLQQDAVYLRRGQ
jgi:FkbM family methyltransferase